ncbi:MAG TPA: ABC transporter ATP-binding protein [Trebonia sp.]
MATSAKAGKEIRLSAAAGEVAARQEAAYGAAVRVRTRARITAAWWRAGGWAVFALGFAAGLALVVWQASRGHGSVGNVVLTITVANSLRTSVQTAVFRSTVSAGYRRLLDPFLWLREYAATERAAAAALAAPDGGDPPARLASGIVLSGLSYTYPGTTRAALDGVSVTLPAGAVVAVVGEYGSGKTTLAKLPCKFYQPSAGTITADGTDLASLDTAAWRAGISAAFQDFGRYNATFRETVQLGGVEDGALPPNGDAAVLAAIAEAGAEDLLARLPGGLDTELGPEFGGTGLSEGQWQKTALARACMRPLPVLLVLDEPPHRRTRPASTRSSSATWPAPGPPHERPARSRSSSPTASPPSPAPTSSW